MKTKRFTFTPRPIVKQFLAATAKREQTSIANKLNRMVMESGEFERWVFQKEMNDEK
jgi:hypothetical protein